MNSKPLTKTLAVALSLTLLFTGCQAGKSSKESEVTESKSISANMKNYGAKITADDIKKAYGKSETNEIMPLYNVAPDEAFDIDFKANSDEFIGVQTEELVSVHTDINCKKESKVYTYNNLSDTKNGGTRFNIAPITSTLATDGEEDDAIKNKKETWGNASMYYIAVWYDTDSDKAVKLDKPKIIPFTIKHELPVPTVKGEVDKTGRFKLKWDKVEGAQSYNIYKFTNSGTDTGSDNKPVAGADKAFNGSYLIKTDATTETEFDNFAGAGHGLAEHERSVSGEKYVLGQNYCVNGSYFVTAVIDGKESSLSNIVNTADLILPYKPVDEDDIMFERYDDESKLPKTMKVLNIDGSVTERNVTYSFFWGTSYASYDNIEGLDARIPEYQYSVEGTAITGLVTMNQKNRMEIYKDKKNGDAPSGIKNSESKNSTAKTDPENKTKYTPDSDVPTIIGDKPAENPGSGSSGDEDKPLVKQQEENTQKHTENGGKEEVENTEDIEIFADSAEEEWIARNLVNGEENISLEAFPELQKYETLEDVFQKVYYQNPYILGVVSYEYDYETLTLKVKYCYSKDEISKKQEEIKTEAEKIVKENIKDGMSDEEKCQTLYNYLNANTSYDNKAVEEAEKTNYKKGDDWKESEDSFNAYGIIVDKKGVCQSYAYAYKLLCSLSGVESRVLTGHLNQTLPHAWNAVKFGEDWYQTDCTNNETNCGIPFFLYEADEDAAKMSGYSEDKLYELDTAVGEYRTDKNDKEFYSVNGLAASNIEEYKQVLEKNIEKSEKIIAVRYTGEGSPDQEEIVKAVREIYNMHGMEDKLEGLGYSYKNGFIVLVNE